MQEGDKRPSGKRSPPARRLVTLSSKHCLGGSKEQLLPLHFRGQEGGRDGDKKAKYDVHCF